MTLQPDPLSGSPTVEPSVSPSLSMKSSLVRGMSRRIRLRQVCVGEETRPVRDSSAQNGALCAAASPYLHLLLAAELLQPLDEVLKL